MASIASISFRPRLWVTPGTVVAPFLLLKTTPAIRQRIYRFLGVFQLYLMLIENENPFLSFRCAYNEYSILMVNRFMRLEAMALVGQRTRLHLMGPFSDPGMQLPEIPEWLQKNVRYIIGQKCTLGLTGFTSFPKLRYFDFWLNLGSNTARHPRVEVSEATFMMFRLGHEALMGDLDFLVKGIEFPPGEQLSLTKTGDNATELSFLRSPGGLAELRQLCKISGMRFQVVLNLVLVKRTVVPIPWGDPRDFMFVKYEMKSKEILNTDYKPATEWVVESIETG